LRRQVVGPRDMLTEAKRRFLATVRADVTDEVSRALDLCKQRKFAEAMSIARTLKDEELATLVVAHACICRSLRRGESQARLLEMFGKTWPEGLRARWFVEFVAKLLKSSRQPRDTTVKPRVLRAPLPASCQPAAASNSLGFFH